MKKSVFGLMLVAGCLTGGVSHALGGAGNQPAGKTRELPGQSGNTGRHPIVPDGMDLSIKEIELLNQSDDSDVIVIDRAEYLQLLKDKAGGAVEGGSAN